MTVYWTDPAGEKRNKAYREEMEGIHASISWEVLAEIGMVDPTSIDGLSDPKWLIGDDVMAELDARICEEVGHRECGPCRIITTSYGLEFEDLLDDA